VRCIVVKPGQADSAGDILGMPEKVSYYPCAFCLKDQKVSDEFTQRALEAHALLEHGKTWAEMEVALIACGDRIQIKQRFAITDIWPTNPDGLYIVVIDEVNRAPPDIRNSLFGLINERIFELSGYRLPKFALIIATANPPSSEYSDVQDLDGAMVKRFVHFQVLPSPEEWLSWQAEQPEAQSDIGRKALSYFREHPEFCTPKDETNPVLEAIQADGALRVNTNLIKMANILDGHRKLLSEAAKGTLGAKAAPGFMQHMSKAEEWVKAKDIFANYAKVAEKVEATKDRMDMFHQTQDDIVRYLKDREKVLKPAELDNLASYMEALQSDQVWALLQSIFSEDAKAAKDANIKRHSSALGMTKRINALVEKHNERFLLVKAGA
jgi:MoxR-like ATPase